MIGLRGDKRVWGGEVTRQMLERAFSGEAHLGNRELIPQEHEIVECLSVDKVWDRIDWCVLKNGVVHGVLILTGNALVVYIPIEKWRLWPVEYPIPQDVVRFNYETCVLCGAKALYRQGRHGYCKDHKSEAVKARTKAFRRYDKGQTLMAQDNIGFESRCKIRDRLNNLKSGRKQKH